MVKLRGASNSLVGRAKPALLILLLLLVSAPALPQDAGDAGIDVRVEYRGDVIDIDVTVPVRASREEIWAVITDYDNATQFITNLKSSKIESRNGNLWTVSQEMIAKLGPFSTEIDTLRELRLTPPELVRSRLLRGNMKRNDSVTRLVTDGPMTSIVMHSESIPDFWIPEFMGRGLIESATREQFVNLRNEILRRKKLALEKDSAH